MRNTSLHTQDTRKRLIIVEDDRDLREDLRDFLTLHGYEVTEVGTASECYVKLIEGNYDLLILDIGLPDQSGLVLAEYVRKNTGIRIVVLSAKVNTEERIAGYEAGVDIYMIKPFDSRELLLMIGNFFLERPASALPEHHEDHEPDAWKLIRKDWRLQTAKGHGINLTAKEFEFIRIMAKERFGAVVNRHDILDLLAYQRDEYGNRAFESMVYRLRHKIEATGEDMPIKTYRGIGYSLSSPILC